MWVMWHSHSCLDLLLTSTVLVDNKILRGEMAWQNVSTTNHPNPIQISQVLSNTSL